ncbi:MAG: Osmosensitive channel histidine kinase KdpD [Polyangiaceae bacterium]|jgi:signal transduction histidine kinase|nr:Osmosensitive channel histidine kinase KdpD [Polyangiaceae bacterium]
MTAPAAPHRSLDELTLGSSMSLEDLVSRDGLNEMVKSAHELFGVPIRVFAEEGKLLADAAESIDLYAYLNTSRAGRAALSEVVAAVKALAPGPAGESQYRCVTGALYRVVAIEYDSRQIGRMILGPFAEPSSLPPSTLLQLDTQLDADQLRTLHAKLPHADEQTVGSVAHHLAKVLDLLLFSGHRALLTSNMHLASVRESFRELEDKNQKLQVAYDRLKELDRLKSNFLATVSHELRTPLTSIIGYSEMLVEGLAGDLTNEQRDFVQTIRDKGDQLLALIKGLLDLSKLESGTMSLRKNHVDVAALVKDVVSTMAPTARKKEVELAFEVEKGLPSIWADAERLRQVLLNLTENAIKFTPVSGAVRLAARITGMEAQNAGDTGGMVLLGARRTAVEMRVADTGIGIPETERMRVFDAFYQVDSSSTREAGGTGLGLSIVKRLVDGHDGTVRIEANQPRGTVFVVTIPVKRATIG